MLGVRQKIVFLLWSDMEKLLTFLSNLVVTLLFILILSGIACYLFEFWKQVFPFLPVGIALYFFWMRVWGKEEQ